jgi:hypothetical protein
MQTHPLPRQVHSFRNLQFPRRVVDMQYVETKIRVAMPGLDSRL